MPLFLLSTRAFFPCTSSAEIFLPLQHELKVQRFRMEFSFSAVWFVTLSGGLILQLRAMMWDLLLQEAGGATPSQLDQGHERQPLATGTLSSLQNQTAKSSRCVRAPRALTSLNVPEEPQLGPPPTAMGPGIGYGGGCWSSDQPHLLGGPWPYTCPFNGPWPHACIWDAPWPYTCPLDGPWPPICILNGPWPHAYLLDGSLARRLYLVPSPTSVPSPFAPH